MSRITESLYRVSGIELNEMALKEMPILDASKNDSTAHQIQQVKDLYKNVQNILWSGDELLMGIKNSEENLSDAVKAVNVLIRRNLLFDIKNNAQHWAGNDINVDIIIETYNNMLKELNKYLNKNYSKKHIEETKEKYLYPLQRLLVNLERVSSKDGTLKIGFTQFK